jgi:hypothetical protein
MGCQYNTPARVRFPLDSTGLGTETFEDQVQPYLGELYLKSDICIEMQLKNDIWTGFLYIFLVF